MIYLVVTLGIVSIASIGALVFQNWLHIKERKSLLNRIMTRNFDELNYYETTHKSEIKKIQDQEKKLSKEDAEAEKKENQILKDNKKEQVFLEGTELDWKPEDVDLKKLKEIMKVKDKGGMTDDE